MFDVAHNADQYFLHVGASTSQGTEPQPPSQVEEVNQNAIRSERCSGSGGKGEGVHRRGFG